MSRADKLRARHENFTAEIKKTDNTILEKFTDEDLDTPIVDTIQKVKQVQLSPYELIRKASADKFVAYPKESLRLQLHTGSKREEMKESIKMDGFMYPVLVWEKDGQLIILSGHNRVDIGKELGIEIPFITMDIKNEKQADRVVIITNLQNRQYSEMKKSEISVLLKELIDSYDESKYSYEVYKDIEENFNFERRQVAAYIRLNYLNSHLLQMVDDSKIPMGAAYKISNASTDKQDALSEFVKQNGIDKISIKNADALAEREQKAWDEEFMMKAFGLITKPKEGRKATSVKLTFKELRNYISSDRIENASEIILNTLATSNKINELFEEKGIIYSEEKLLEIIEKNL